MYSIAYIKGDKSTQDRDILHAKAYFAEYKELEQ